MSKDTTATAPSTMKIKVVAPPDGNNFCWRQTLPLRKSVANRRVRRPRWMVDGNTSVEESPLQRKEQLRFVSASRFYWCCCHFDVPCDCRQGPAADCQCEEASYASLCDAGTPRDCSAPPLKVSRLKAFSRVRTTVSMAACGCPVCEKHQTLYQRDRPGWPQEAWKVDVVFLLQPDLLEGKHGHKTIFTSCQRAQ